MPFGTQRNLSGPWEMAPTDPSLWTQYFTSNIRPIWSLTRHMPGPCGQLEDLVQRMAAADDATWAILWNTNIFGAFAGLLVDKCLCGYTKEEVSDEAKIPVILNRVVGPLKGISVCIERIRAAGVGAIRPEIREAILDLLDKEIIRLWRNVWEIQGPLLQAKEIDPMCTGVFSDHLTYVIHIVYAVLCEHRPASLKIYAAPENGIRQLLLLGWTQSNLPDLRESNLSLFYTAALCGPANRGSSCDIQVVIREVLDRQPGIHMILQRLFGQLKDKRVEGDQLVFVALTAAHFAPQINRAGTLLLVNVAREVTSLDHKIVWRFFAACRRHLCKGDATRADFLDVFRYAYMYMEACMPKNISDLPETVSERDVHALIELLARQAIPISRPNDNHFSPYVEEPVAWCKHLLAHFYAPQGRPVSRQLAYMRQRSYDIWQSTLPALRSKRYITAGGSSVPALRRWMELEKILISGVELLAASQPVDYPFNPTERCHWSDCLCHVHEPSHDMKVCKGCWAVAYCCDKCQTNDWEGHKAQCSGR